MRRNGPSAYFSATRAALTLAAIVAVAPGGARADGSTDDVLARYSACFEGLAWATPLSGERMVRHDIFRKTVVGGQPVYFLFPSIYPPSFEETTYLFAGGKAFEVAMGQQPVEEDRNEYLPLKHHYFNFAVPSVVGDLASARAWTGTDTILKAFEAGSPEADQYRAAHPLVPANPTRLPLAKGSTAADALKAELLAALEEVKKTSISKLERQGPDYYKEHPEQHNIFDRFTQALESCALVPDPAVQDAVTSAHTRVSAEYALYIQRFPPQKETGFDRFCRALTQLIQ